MDVERIVAAVRSGKDQTLPPELDSMGSEMPHILRFYISKRHTVFID
jgi:hypothetical protein